MTERERIVGAIEARVRPTVCATYSVRAGQTVEGRISQDDLDVLVALAKTAAGAPLPPAVAAMLSRRAVQ